MSHKSKKFHYEVSNQNSVSEISIYGYIGQWEDVDYKGFQNAFRDILTKNKEITVRIHSGGGSVYEGLAIYDLMRSSDSKITVVVEGMAASMASIIALGGDIIKMTENAFFMMHAPSSGAWGDKTVMQSAADQLIKAENRLVEIYKERTKADEAVILGWMEPNNDTWVDSASCKEMHICDEVIKPSKNRQFQGTPEDILNKTPEEVFAAYGGEVPDNIKNKTNLKMKNRIIAVLALAGISHTLTASSPDEDFENVLNDHLKKSKRCDTAEAALKDFQTTNAQLLIDKAVEDGKLTAAEKDEWLKDAIANPGLTARALSKMNGKPDLNAGITRDPKNTDTGKHSLLKGREDWTFDKWQAEDPKGFEKLEDESPEEFEKIFNAKFN